MANDIFFLAEYADGAPSRSAIELATGAADLAKASGGDAVGLAYGPGAADAAGLGAYGANRVIMLGDEERPAISFAAVAVAAVRGAPHPLAVLAPATPNGRDLAAALVGSLDLPAFGPVRSVEVVDGRMRSEQATLQGSVITTSEPADGVEGPSVLLVLPSTFSPEEGGGSAELTRPSAVDDGAFAKVSIVERHPAEARVANLEEASVIVAGGRGVGGEAGFELLQQLADALGGTVGASRAAADAGWVPYQLQIGQTGKVVKPALYIGCGISGAIQHRVGMQTAEHVVAINKDPDAPIGEFADLFVVGDLFAVVPKLIDQIRARKGS